MSDLRPGSWRRTTLGALGKFTTSSVDKLIIPSERSVRLVNYMDVYHERFIHSGLSLMTVTATPSEVQRFQVEVGDILFTPSSETPDDIGHSAVIVDHLPNTLHSYHTVRLRPNRKQPLDLRFSGWFANAEYLRFHFAKRASGSTRYTLTLREFALAPVAIPVDPAEQRGIAEVLDTIDEVIRQTAALIAKLKRLKQGLLHDLLTRGLDENGELRDPVAHSEQFKESPLGRIPRRWEVRQLGSMIVLGPQNGLYKPDSAYTDSRDGVRIVRIDSFNNGDTVKDQLLRRVRLQDGEQHRFTLAEGDLLINRVNSIDYVGKSALVGQMEDPAVFESNIMRLVIDSERLLPAFTIRVLQSPASQSYFRRNAKSAVAQASINQTDVRRLRLSVPPVSEQETILEATTAQDTSICAEEVYRDKLQLLKKGLMQDLLTGRVRVPLPEVEPQPIEVGT